MGVIGDSQDYTHYNIWLVVSNMNFIFHFIYGIILPIDKYFSEGLKPRTRSCVHHLSDSELQHHLVHGNMNQTNHGGIDRVGVSMGYIIHYYSYTVYTYLSKYICGFYSRWMKPNVSHIYY